MNRYPLWKYLLMLGLVVLAALYALPNLFIEDPAVQISAKNGVINATVSDQVKAVLQSNQLAFISIDKDREELLVRFADGDTQLKASDVIKATLGNDYIVALNLAPRTPHWLQALGAHPMKLGLDLRGGVHFLLDVNTDAVITVRQEGDIRTFTDQLRAENIRFT